jgi:hypothetical protein
LDLILRRPTVRGDQRGRPEVESWIQDEIGRAIAEHLAEPDWKVVATDNPSAAEELQRSYGVVIRRSNLADRTSLVR